MNKTLTILRNEAESKESLEFQTLSQSFARALNGDMDNGLAGFLYSTPEYESDPARGAYHFDQLIKKCNEYYVYQSEIDIIQAMSEQLTSYLPGDVSIIEYGPGPRKSVYHKTLPLLKNIDRFSNYIAVDICQKFSDSAIVEIVKYFSHPIVDNISRDFLDPELDFSMYKNPVLISFGGSLFNLSTESAEVFNDLLVKNLHTWRNHIGGEGYLIISQDTMQDSEILLRAYRNTPNEELIRSVLYRIDRDLDVRNWNPMLWNYKVTWDNNKHRIDMGFEAASNHNFMLEGKRIFVEKGQYLHIESSYKLPEGKFIKICRKAGFMPIKTFRLPGNPIALHLLKVAA